MASAGGLRGGLPVRTRRLPSRGLPHPRRRTRRARVRAHRRGQDRGGGVRRAPGPGRGREVLLHHPDQSAVEPEVQRPRRRPRRRERRPAHRRHGHQRRGPDRRHDHRGPAQHDLRGLLHPARTALCGHGRGPLPRRPLPRGGVGGDHHRTPARGPGRLPLRHRLQCRGVRRLAQERARLHRGRRLRDPPGPAVAAHDGRRRPARPVRARRRLRLQRTAQKGRPRPGAERRPLRRAPPRRPPLRRPRPRHLPPRPGRPAARHLLHLLPRRMRCGR